MSKTRTKSISYESDTNSNDSNESIKLSKLRMSSRDDLFFHPNKIKKVPDVQKGDELYFHPNSLGHKIQQSAKAAEFDTMRNKFKKLSLDEESSELTGTPGLK